MCCVSDLVGRSRLDGQFRECWEFLNRFIPSHEPPGNVWSATAPQAKNESENSLVCANVYGLRWSAKLLALMECAAPSSYLVRQS